MIDFDALKVGKPHTDANYTVENDENSDFRINFKIRPFDEIFSGEKLSDTEKTEVKKGELKKITKKTEENHGEIKKDENLNFQNFDDETHFFLVDGEMKPDLLFEESPDDYRIWDFLITESKKIDENFPYYFYVARKFGATFENGRILYNGRTASEDFKFGAFRTLLNFRRNEVIALIRKAAELEKEF